MAKKKAGKAKRSKKSRASPRKSSPRKSSPRKSSPKQKVASPQQKQQQAFARKVRFINKRISEIYDFFGEHSEEYKQIQTLVSTQFGISDFRKVDRTFFQTTSPINFQTSATFIRLAYEDPNQIFANMHESLKGRTVYQITKEKYADKLNGISTAAQFEQNKKKLSTSIKTTNVSKLDIIVRNLPSFYDALSQTDTYFQAEYREKFRQYGHSKDESQAEEIMKAIQQYIQAKMVEGEKIKSGAPLLSDDDEDYPFMQEYTPQLFNGNDNDEPDWGNAISKLKK